MNRDPIMTDVLYEAVAGYIAKKLGSDSIED